MPRMYTNLPTRTAVGRAPGNGHGHPACHAPERTARAAVAPTRAITGAPGHGSGAVVSEICQEEGKIAQIHIQIAVIIAVAGVGTG